MGNGIHDGERQGQIHILPIRGQLLELAQIFAAGPEDLQEIRQYVAEFCRLFGYDAEKVMDAPFTVVTPDSRNPYRQMYVAN